MASYNELLDESNKIIKEILQDTRFKDKHPVYVGKEIFMFLQFNPAYFPSVHILNKGKLVFRFFVSDIGFYYNYDILPGYHFSFETAYNRFIQEEMDF